jgi:hypothetical protein
MTVEDPALTVAHAKSFVRAARADLVELRAALIAAREDVAQARLGLVQSQGCIVASKVCCCGTRKSALPPDDSPLPKRRSQMGRVGEDDDVFGMTPVERSAMPLQQSRNAPPATPEPPPPTQRTLTCG